MTKLIKKYKNPSGTITKQFNTNPDYYDSNTDYFWQDYGYHWEPYSDDMYKKYSDDFNFPKTYKKSITPVLVDKAGKPVPKRIADNIEARRKKEYEAYQNSLNQNFNIDLENVTITPNGSQTELSEEIPIDNSVAKPGAMEYNPDWYDWRQNQIAQDIQIGKEREQVRKNNKMLDHLFVTLPAALTLAPIVGYELAAAAPAAYQWLTTNPVGQELVRSTVYGEGLNQISKLLGYEDWGEVPYKLFGGKDYAHLNQWAKLGLNFTNPGYLFRPMVGEVTDAMSTLTEQAMKSVPTRATTGDLAREMNKQLHLFDKNQALIKQNEHIVDPLIRKFTTPGGDIRLRLYSHTETNPREIVIKPQGENKFEVHIRTWDGDHVPANLSKYEKYKLFEALHEQIPEGGEILFPKSNPDYVATRGTVAALKKLSRDPRYMEGDPGSLLYRDKNGEIKTFDGTSFIKKVTEDSNPKPLNLSKEETSELKHRLFNIVINSASKTQRQRAWKALFYISEGSPATGKDAALSKLITDNYYTIEKYIKTGDRSLLKELDKGYIGQVTKEILDSDKRIGETKLRQYLDFAHRDDITLVDLTLGVKDNKVNIPEIYKLLKRSPGLLDKQDRIQILEGEVIGSKKAITNKHVLGLLKSVRVKGITPIVAKNGTNGERAIQTLNNERPIFSYSLEQHRIQSKEKGVYNTGGMWNYIYSDPTTGKYKIIELDIFKHSDLDVKYQIGNGKGFKEELQNNLLKRAINTAEDTPVVVIGERQLTTNDVLNQLNGLEKTRIKILDKFKSGEITEAEKDKIITKIQDDIDKAYSIMSDIDPSYYINNRTRLDAVSENLSGTINIGEGVERPIKESDKHFNAALEKITGFLKKLKDKSYLETKKDHKTKLNKAIEIGDKLQLNIKETSSKVSQGNGNQLEELWLKWQRPKLYKKAKANQDEELFKRSLQDEEFMSKMNVLAQYSSTPIPRALKKRKLLKKTGKLNQLNVEDKAKNTVYILNNYTPTTKNKYELLKMIQNDETLLPDLRIEQYSPDGKIDKTVIEAYEPRLREYKQKFKDFLIDASQYIADPETQLKYKKLAEKIKMYKQGNKF